MDGGINTSAYVSDPNQWIDPMGLQLQSSNNNWGYMNTMGAGSALRQYEKNKKENAGYGIPPNAIANALDKAATGKSACASAVVGVGFGGCVGYKGNGVIDGSLERSIGLYGEAAVFNKAKEHWGQKKDGNYYEGCGATGKKKYCAGLNNDNTTYGYSQKVVTGKVVGLKLSEGSRSTRDLKEPMKGLSPNVSSKFGFNYYDLPNQGMR